MAQNEVVQVFLVVDLTYNFCQTFWRNRTVAFRLKRADTEALAKQELFVKGSYGVPVSPA